jgi:cytoskeleton protein RodZ
VTVREVADTLNLSITVVQALEADDYDRLPGTVFARGYIRAYARLLELDPVPLLERYPGHGPGPEVHPVVNESGIAEWIRRRPGLVLSVLALVVVGALAGVAALLWPEEGIESLWRSVDSPTVAVPPADAESGDWQWQDQGAGDELQGPAGAAQAAGAGTESEVDPDAAGAAETANEPGPETAPGSGEGPVVQGTPLEGTAGAAAQRITETGDQRLQLEFSADSWVEIRNPEGRVLYSNLNEAGTSLELVGQGPFRILLGYAPGVTLAFQGEQVALGPHTRNNVATLVLGQ